jgi:hypothetical protein
MASSPSMFGDGPAAQADLAPNDYIQPNLGHGLRIWWAFFWRNTLVALGLSFQLGVAVQWLAGRGVVSDRMRPLFLQFGAYALNYVPAIFVMYFIVRKRFRGFRIRLTTIGGGDSPRTLQPTPKRVFRIWWTYTWRTAVYTVVLSVAMNVPMGFLIGAATVISPTFGRVFTVFQSLVVAGAIGLFVIYSNILDEEIADFCVGLVPTAPLTPVPTAGIAPTAETGGPAPS